LSLFYEYIFPNIEIRFDKSIVRAIPHNPLESESLDYSIIENYGRTVLHKIEDSGVKWTKIGMPATAVCSDLRISSQG
jgi:hypothetical protein